MADTSRLIVALNDIVGDAFVDTTTVLDAHRVDGHVAWAVVTPGDVNQVAAVLTLAHHEQLAVIPWGGGTTMGLGHPPDRLDVILRLQRLTQVLEYEPADLTATAEAGISMTDLQNHLGRRGQWWPIVPPLANHATLGGVLATNTSGPKRLLYGTARDLLIGVKVVQADGVISKAGGKVTKNVTGYDMMKLYIGSLGTLAVIVEATLKLRPLPAVQQIALATFTAGETAQDTARRLITSGLLPNAVELVNPPLSALLCETRGDLQGPEGWSLVVGIDGPKQAVARQLSDLETLSREAGAVAWWNGADDGRLWQTLQDRFRPHGDESTASLVIRIGTVPTQIGAVLNRLTALGTHLQTPVELTARVGNGLVYGNFLLSSAANHSASLLQTLGEIRAQLAPRHGYLVVESAPPALKTQFDCWGDLGPQAEVMAGLKREFDPRRVLNPGRFIHHL